MTITLKLFSSLMEYLPAGTEDNTVSLSGEELVSCNQLIERYQIPQTSVQVTMVNGQFVPPEQRDEPLKDGDMVSIWPSIQGG